MGFAKDKRKALAKFDKALERKEVDEPIIYLLKLINSSDNFYTTSSCAGRIIILQELSKRKIDHNFIMKEHEKVDINEILKKDFLDLRGRIWLKQEPFIIHIVGKNLRSIIDMLELGLESGLKHSGVFVFKPERYILELNGTQHMSVPIIDNGKVLISKEYFSYLLEIANDKLEKNKQMRNKFEKLVKEYIYE
jgi:tRNA wybutosine-synthesizing protein 3